VLRSLLRSLVDHTRANLLGRRMPPGVGGPLTPARDRGTVRDRTVRDRGGAAIRVEYSPRADGRPDPGEIVWTWVPYEEDPSQGKDRPVLLVARRGPGLVGLMLTSKDHDRDAADERRYGRQWVDIGPGAWDRQGRPSEVRLDRLLDIDPATVRREGAVLDRARFDTVVAAAARLHGWS
jgi:hypothetical protein